MPIVINESFINGIINTLNSYADGLARLRAGDPPFANLVVKAGADDFTVGTTLESAVSAAGTALENRLKSLEENLTHQARQLQRLLEMSEDIESLNTESVASIRPRLDPDFIGPS